ncbi:MAG: fumarylacetoacetate hydrolase family protein [Spirochaetales bacterium]|nr:fumarylacetoacetate hydrolase family protein [Spirochaetales bacterium]
MSLTLPIIGTTDAYEVSPSKILAVGLNYRAHVQESESIKIRGLSGEEPEEPVLFNMTQNALNSSGSPIVLPTLLSHVSASPRTDYEGELVVVMGRDGKNIPEEKALDWVLGYTCGNDVSQRDLQNSDRSGWFRGKSLDGFAPIGPALMLTSSCPDPSQLAITTRLNGTVVQAAHTHEMIFSVSHLIAYISQYFTLKAGDLIFTGTPSGVGPLAPGDHVEVEIEGIGVLSNPVVAEEQ